MERIAEGARFIALRGARRCLWDRVTNGELVVCGERIESSGVGASGRPTRRDYCRRHDGDSLHERRERAIERTFRYAVAAMPPRLSPKQRTRRPGGERHAGKEHGRFSPPLRAPQYLVVVAVVP